MTSATDLKPIRMRLGVERNFLRDSFDSCLGRSFCYSLRRYMRQAWTSDTETRMPAELHQHEEIFEDYLPGKFASAGFAFPKLVSYLL